MNLPSLSVVVPVYNSEETLPVLVSRLEAVLAAHGSLFEVVLVNDGSKDNSWDVIQELAARFPWVHGINLARNFGQHNALLCGIRAARHEIIITLDDDLQNPPEEIPKFLDKIAEGYDVVYGKPAQERHGLFRDMASKMTKLAMQKAMGAAVARHVSAYRAFRTQLRDCFADYTGPHVSIDVLLSWSTSRFEAITVDHRTRVVGRSNYTFSKLVRHALNMMLGFTETPLRIASALGFLFMLLGMLLAVVVLVRYWIEGGSVPGFPFLASSIAIFSGIQLFTLGVYGEYLARIHFRQMGRPSYVVRDSAAAAPRLHEPAQVKSTGTYAP